MLVDEVVILSDLYDSTAGRDGGHVVDLALEQSPHLGGRRCRFELWNQQILSVRITQVFHKPRAFRLHLDMLDPKPRHSLSVSWPAAISCMLLATATLVTVASDRPPWSIALAALLGASTVLALLLALYHSHVLLTFCSRNGRVPVLHLYRGRPERQTFELFVRELVQRINSAGGNSAASEALNTELREHRQLMQAGIISEQQYESAKSRILVVHR